MSSLSAGRTTACTSGGCAGGAGADYLYLANANEVTSVTTNASGTATAITMTSTAVNFYAYDFRDESAQFIETVTVDETTKNVSVEQTFTMIWPCRNMTDRNLIMDMAQQACGMVAVHKEETGTYWIWGHTGTGSRKRVRVSTVEGDSGAALTDPNQETVNLRCVAAAKAVELYDGATVMAALI